MPFFLMEIQEAQHAVLEGRRWSFGGAQRQRGHKDFEI